MPSQASVDAFVAHVLSEDHVGAIHAWYAEDAAMQENQEPPRVGLANLVEAERGMLARFAGVKSELLAPPLVVGDHVALRWRFTFTTRSGRALSMEEVAWQVWRGEKIQHETFFYDPRQMGA